MWANLECKKELILDLILERMQIDANANLRRGVRFGSTLES